MAENEDVMINESLGGAIIYYVNGEKEELFFFRDDTAPDAQQATVESSTRS